MPYMSVLVPVYNSLNTVEQCLKAVRGSSYKDYELIVIDDASQDGTILVAQNYADKLLKIPHHSGRLFARRLGMESAAGEVIVNIDSDILIKPDTLQRIADHLLANPHTAAVTGMLSKECPHKNFFSQYKNLYMHYIFRRLPDRVNFLYGSIYAIRRAGVAHINSLAKIADDTELGQEIASKGGRIDFLPAVEVTHLKKYNLSSFIKNDFIIPFEWAGLFCKYKGWAQLRSCRRFAHSSNRQILSILSACLLMALTGISFLGMPVFIAQAILSILWAVLNIRFMEFLLAERGIGFAALSIFITFIDNLVMFCGVLIGFLMNASGRGGSLKIYLI